MKTITDIFALAFESLSQINCSINGGCNFCAYADRCTIICNAVHDMLKAGEYH